jgi:transcriptional regulator with XRE-family HTH domain
METKFGHRIRAEREKQQLLLREVAAMLSIDTAQLSKLERGDRIAKKEFVFKIADTLKIDKKELHTLWLADQVYDVLKNEDNAIEAMMVAEEIVKYEKK